MMAKLSETKELIRELAELLKETDLSEIEVEDDDFRIRVARGVTSVVERTSSASQAAAAPAATAPAAQAEEAGEKAQPEQEAAPQVELEVGEHPGTVTSPMVGTAYTAPEPGADPFIKVGDTVAEGQTLLIIEAMKVMNPIPAPAAGKVTKILFEDSQPVEFGQPLVVIE